MAESTVTPLQLTAGVGFYSGNAITANTDLANSISAYSTVLVGNLLTTIAAAASNVTLNISANTLANLKSLGSNVAGNYCPALADSVPSNVVLAVNNAGYTGTITTNATTYLGSGDFGIFAQAFGAAQGYISLTNQVINSAVNVNSNNYLGPTFSNMNDLITAGITKVTLATTVFGADLAATGELIGFDNIENFGTPSAILQQLARAGNMINGTLPCVQTRLNEAGLSDVAIANLVNNNQQSLFNQSGLTANEFNSLQRLAYQGMCNVAGACLQEVLDTLKMTTPNITAMCDLLDPSMIFPNSYTALTLPTSNGPVLIYDTTGAVNSVIEPLLNSGSITPVGCDEMSKIMPSAQAAANRALQVALQQINGITNTTAPRLAAILQ